MTPDQLRKIATDLSVIADEGRLGEVQIAFAQACREAGGLPSADERQRQLSTMQIGASMKAKDIGGVMSKMFALPSIQAEQIARDALVHDTFSALALDVIADFLPEQVPQPTATPKQEGARKW